MAALDPNTTIELVASTPDTESFRRELFVSTLAPGLDDPALRALGLAELQWRAHEANLERYGESLEDSLLSIAGVPVGRLILNRGAAALRVVDLAIVPQLRGRGLGTRVIDMIKERAVELGVPVHLSVFEANPARSLYHRVGFSEVSTTPPYIGMCWAPATGPASGPGEAPCQNHS